MTLSPLIRHQGPFSKSLLFLIVQSFTSLSLSLSLLLVKDMRSNYRRVKFVNLSMSSLGVFSNERPMFLEMMNDISIDNKQQHYIIILKQ